MTQDKGYYRQPALYGERLIFVSEADLWSVDLRDQAKGPLMARRLTAHQVDAFWPVFSPDGSLISFSAREEGATEIYVMTADGGRAVRLTFQGSRAYPCAFSRDGQEVIYASIAASHSERIYRLWSIAISGGEPRLWPIGPVRRFAQMQVGGTLKTVITRREQEIARWKRYRGGTKGDLWLDDNGQGSYRELLPALEGNLGSPCFARKDLYALADHEGYGNVYRVDIEKQSLERLTNHRDYYARALTSDGQQLAYQCGADLYLLDPQSGESRRLDIRINSSKPQLTRRFVSPARYLQGYGLHPEGHSLLVTARGKPFAMGNWERDVQQLGERDGVRYRLSVWMPDDKHMLTVSDAGGEEALELHQISQADSLNDGDASAASLTTRFDGLDTGRIRALAVSPTGAHVALGNHRCEVVLVDLQQRTAKVLDQALHSDVLHLRFSPDGRWLAYSAEKLASVSQIYVAAIESGEVKTLTAPVGMDFSPSWSPDGMYLYFLSARTFDPIYDAVRFDLAFPKATRAYLVTLRKGLNSPFNPAPRPLDAASKSPAPEPRKSEERQERHKSVEAANHGSDHVSSAVSGEAEDERTSASRSENEGKSSVSDLPPVGIDFDGIEGRMIEVPNIPEGRYSKLVACKGRLFISENPMEGSLSRAASGERSNGRLHTYDLDSQKLELFADGVSSFVVSYDNKTLCYRAQGRLRVVKTSGKPDSKESKPGRASGWIDLERIRLSIMPDAEWRQMYREMWRLQRDHFWTTDLSNVDWQRAHDRYLPILSRVATRSEFSDLAWELQGELGTSHAYEMGGDVRQPPAYSVGKLAAELSWDGTSWVITAMTQGDSWNRFAASPLASPGVELNVGDRILMVDGQRLDERTTPAQLLVHKAHIDVGMLVLRKGQEQPQRVVIKPLGNEHPLYYRAWVESNRACVRQLSAGRLGYVHVPDMGPNGYAEFFRHYLQESDRQGLIVDVRYNGGGHISQLLLEKLARRRLGYSVSHHLKPSAYPAYSVLGPIVCLTNEHAGSDGDIFSHAFKLMKLGLLVGKRTWGGVIGIDNRNSLVDGTLVTQPEYSTWFKDVGFGVENYGTDPDIEVDISPQDYANGQDPQLARAVELALRDLTENPPPVPDFSQRPNLAPP